MSIFVVFKKTGLLTSKTFTIMDILLQYLNIRKQRQQYIKVADVPCNSVYQSIHSVFKVGVHDKAMGFINCLRRTYKSEYMFVGIIDAQYCNRAVLTTLPYADFCRLACGPGEASGTV